MTPEKPSSPVAEIVSIGDEMTSGARLDTNSQWLSVALRELGVRVLFHTTVGDSLEACRQVIEIAVSRANIVVVTGGLGPTADDLTRETLAAAAGVPLEFRQQAMDHIEQLFASRAREMPQRNRVQAMFPVGSQIIDNPQGTAPGIDMQFPVGPASVTRLFALPGVPAEMQQMWALAVRPRIIQHLGRTDVLCHAVIKCFGVGESDMEALLGEMIARRRSPLVGITVSRATISLRIDATAATRDEAQLQIAATRGEIYKRAGQYVFGEGEAFELEHAVTAALSQRGQSVGVVECGHAGVVAGALAACESPNTYRGGCQFPDPAAAADWLESVSREPTVFPPETLRRQERLVIAARQLWRCDWCLMIDAYPSILAEEGQILPAADVQFWILGPCMERPSMHAQRLGGHPEILHARIAKAGLFELLQHLRASHAASPSMPLIGY